MPQSTIEECLQIVGNKGKYQKLLTVYLFVIYLLVGFLLKGPTLIFMNTLFTCSFAEGVVDEAEACPRINECEVENGYTISSMMGLYCDRQTQRNLIQSCIAIGSLIGLFLITPLADTRGRKFVFILNLVLGIAGVSMTIVGAYSQLVFIIIFGQILNGMSSYTLSVMFYIILQEFCEQDFKQIAFIIMSFSWSLSSAVLGLFYYYFNQWQNFLIICNLIPLIGCLLITFFFLLEAPNHFHKQNKMKECYEVLEQIALYNKTTHRLPEVKQLIENESSSNEDKQSSTINTLKQIWKDKAIVKSIAIFILIEGGSNLYNFGSDYALNDIGFSYGVNFITTSIVELIAYIFLSFTVTKIPRKNGIVLFNGIVCILGLLFFIPFFTSSQLVITIVLCVIRFFSTLAYSIVLMYLTEVFPIDWLGTCSGIVEGLAQGGSFLAPIIITFCINYKIFPIIVLSFFLFVLVVVPPYFITTKIKGEEKDQEHEEDIEEPMVINQ